MSTSLFKSSLLFVAVCVTQAQAYERQHTVHVHGEAELNIAVENKVIELVLKSPLANIVGFEHEATSAQDVAALEAAKTALQDAYARVQLPDSAVCMLDDVDVHFGEEHDDHDHEEHAHQTHDEHDHAGHEHKDHDGHDHDEQAHKDHDHHDHEEGEHGAHRDMHAHYKFKCVKPANLDSVKLDFFTKFPGMKALHVNLLTEKGARQVELTPNNGSIDL